MRRPLMRRVVIAVAVISLGVLVAATPGVAQATKHVKLVSSLPMRGVSTAETQPVVNAIRMALDEAGLQVGDFVIDYQALDDGDAAGMWDTAMETTNAQNATADLTVVAYLGPYNAGAARVSIPILCK